MLEFTTGLDNLENFVDYPTGVLLGFSLDSVKYVANIERNTKLNEIVVKANGTTESTTNNNDVITKNDFTYNFKGYFKIGTEDKISGADIEKYYGELIAYLPNTFNKTLAQFHISDLKYKEPSFFNLLHNDDYNKLVFENETHYSVDYKYGATSPFNEQHELNKELVARNITR